MNINKLQRKDVQKWIELHVNDDLNALSFKKSPFDDLNMPELLQQIQGRKIAQKKFPLLNKNGILFPSKLNLEQTSSQHTAEYKANLIQGDSIMDLTGGFGIDCIAFANNFQQVYHIESNEILQRIAQTNFEALGLKNIQSYQHDAIIFLKDFNQKIDVLYIDPSRRDERKKRVFLLENLTPNILEIMNLMQNKSNQILIKLSPLIDLKYLLNTLPAIEEIHVVALRNEVKEILVKIGQNSVDNPKIHAVNLASDHMDFTFYDSIENPFKIQTSELKKYLYQPNAAVQKSGGNDILAQNFQLSKLHPNTQLYTSNELLDDYPGRIFEIEKPIKNPKKELRNLSIMAIHKNFPESLINLRKKYKFTTDGKNPILFTNNQNRYLIQALKVKKL